MTWLERLRQQNTETSLGAVPKVPERPFGTFGTEVREESQFLGDAPKNTDTPGEQVPKVPKVPVQNPHPSNRDVPKIHFGTFGTPGEESFHSLRGADPETIQVPYQRLWINYDVADGTYTPAQLRRARKRVRPWGGVLSYRLTAGAPPAMKEA